MSENLIWYIWDMSRKREYPTKKEYDKLIKKDKMFINIQNKYNEIEQHIIANQKDIFNMYNHYTKKWRGNRLNDVNVGMFLGDGNIPTVQIFVRNKTGCIKSHILFNKAGDKVIDIKTLNTTF